MKNNLLEMHLPNRGVYTRFGTGDVRVYDALISLSNELSSKKRSFRTEDPWCDWYNACAIKLGLPSCVAYEKNPAHLIIHPFEKRILISAPSDISNEVDDAMCELSNVHGFALHMQANEVLVSDR